MKKPKTSFMRKNGFTVTEVLMALWILAITMTAVGSLFITVNKQWYATSLQSKLANKVSIAMQKLTYGVVYDPYYPGLRAAEQASISISSTASNWAIIYSTPDTTDNSFFYNGGSQSLFFTPGGSATPLAIATNVIASTITTNAFGDGVEIMIRMSLTEGRYCYTNTMSSAISFRN